MLEALPLDVQEHVVRFLDIATKRALRGASRATNALVTPHVKFEGPEVRDMLARVSAFVPEAENRRTYVLRRMRTYESYYDAARELVSQCDETFDSDIPIEGAAGGVAYDIAGVSRLATAQLGWALGRAGTAAFCIADFEPLGFEGPVVSITAHKAGYSDHVSLTAHRHQTEELCNVIVDGTAWFYGSAPSKRVRAEAADAVWATVVLAAVMRLRPLPAARDDVKFRAYCTLARFALTPVFDFASALFPGRGLLTLNPKRAHGRYETYFVESVL